MDNKYFRENYISPDLLDIWKGPMQLGASNNVFSQVGLGNIIHTILLDFNTESYLLGGAPRDWSRGVMATDLDFYLYPAAAGKQGLFHNTSFSSVLSKLNFVRVANRAGDEEQAGYNNLSTRSFSLSSYENPLGDIQLIYFSKPITKEDILKSFSSTICEFYFDFKKQRIGATTRCKTYLENNSSLLKIEHEDSYHAKKMIERFPGINFVPFTY